MKIDEFTKYYNFRGILIMKRNWKKDKISVVIIAIILTMIIASIIMGVTYFLVPILMFVIILIIGRTILHFGEEKE